jgi:hypothetical protein
MATFSPKRIDLQNINNGTRYEAYDGISSEAVNAPIEASAYAQDLSERAIVKSDNALEKVNDSNAGTVTLGAYPIGSIYMSVNSVSPAELFGGTWEKLESRFLYASDETRPAATAGGFEKLHLTAFIGNYDSNTGALGWTISEPAYSAEFTYGTIIGSTDYNISPSRINNHVVVADALQHAREPSIIPPYYSVNMWKRIG